MYSIVCVNARLVYNYALYTDLLWFIFHRRASLRPASTFDRSAPILSPRTFSSSQSSSTSTTPPDHSHFHFLSTLPQASSLAESHDLDTAHDDSHSQETKIANDQLPPDHCQQKDETFQRREESDIQELQTLNRQTVSLVRESLAAQRLLEDGSDGERCGSDEREGEEVEGGDSQPHPSNLIGQSSSEKALDFDVLVASASGEDWELIESTTVIN